MMRRLGVHTSIAGGLHRSLERAYALGCNTIQIFSHNPRGWQVKRISEEDLSLFKSLRRKLNISPVYIHTSYLINMASNDKNLRKNSMALLVTEMDRADAIEADYVILHTGSASGEEKNISRKRAIDTLNEVAGTGLWKAALIIENTAGEKGDITSTIADLSEIMFGVKGSLVSGICFDTCHAFAAGYDIRKTRNILKISCEIEKYFGAGRIKLIHLNDSKGDMGSCIDRHEHIGLGKIGMHGLMQFINSEIFRDVPLILETPKKKDADDPINLEKARKMIR